MASSSSRAKVQTRIVLQAAYDGDLRILKKMAKQMDLGVAEDDEGANALHLAAHGGCLECCKFLVEEAWIDVNSTTTKGTTPLVCAVFDGNIEVMKYLLDRGGNPRKKTPGGLTLLHAAAAKGLCEPLKLLLSEGNPADIMLEDHGGTPLHAAASGGHDEAMKILLEHGADPNRLMGHNITPLMLACCRNSLKCMKLLIEAGADVNGSYCGPTSLTQAVKNGFTDIVKFLLEAGADPNDPGEDGEIPIQLAAKRGDRGLVEVLFSKTNPVPSLPYWSVDGIIRMMKSPLIRRQDEVPVGARATDFKSWAKEAFRKKDYHAALYFFGRDYYLVNCDFPIPEEML
ncbi:ankyrin-1-like [Lolium rigidum]|uniref:ankyrin-1-like n=1 Tax=Lolium rigidum TaxID=89674 RepID=UPI001F5D8BB9|nr:ankyrin-1-like [Lolium rigidum]